MEFDVNYFISKYLGIPDERWCLGEYDGCNNTHCAIGHIGCYTPPARILRNMFGLISSTPELVNDGRDPDYQQLTAKQRILTALYDIKKLQNA